MNRIVAVTENGLEYEADQRHSEILMSDTGIDEGNKAAATAAVGGVSWRRRKLVPSGAG